jgi:hypothetical protein
MSTGHSILQFMARLHGKAHSTLVMFVLSMFYFALMGCATWQAPPEFDVSALRARAVTNEVKGIRLSAAVLSTEDSKQMFGANINKTEVQPIWIEVDNSTTQTLWLLRPGTDPDIFSPLEVAWSFHTAFSSETNARLDDHFDALSFQNPIAPNSKRSGIIFTNPHQEIRLLNVDLLGQGQIFPFTLFPLIPDDSQGEHARAIVKRFTETKADDYQDTASFRAMLEQLPCCATSVDGAKSGDPVNVILVGEFEDISAALVRRGFRVKILDFDDAQYLYGQPPDAVVRKTGQGGVAATWLRIWIAPLRYQGNAVFLVQAGRPVGGRFIVTEDENKDPILHPNVDEARNLFIQDMMYSGGLGKLAFVTGVGVAERDKPRASFDGASYYTDGLRTVMFFVTRPRSMSEVEILDWHPILKLREADSAKE